MYTVQMYAFGPSLHQKLKSIVIGSNTTLLLPTLQFSKRSSHTFAHTHTHMHSHSQTYTRTNSHTHRHARTHAHTHTHTHTHTRAHTHSYTHTHTHTHTHTPVQQPQCSIAAQAPHVAPSIDLKKLPQLPSSTNTHVSRFKSRTT